MADSYWLEDAMAPLPAVWLSGPPEAVVVGGGVTGCACALTLAQAGLRVRLHEAREIASGASGRNGGFALRGAAMPYVHARAALGRDTARSLWRFTERGLERLAGLAGDAFTHTGSRKLAADGAERELLRAEQAALLEDGFEAGWRDDLSPPLQGRYHGALLHPNDGSLQPALWVRRLAAQAAAAGAEIRERSRVEALAELGDAQIVIATDGYTGGLVPLLDAAVRPTRGQVLVTEPLTERFFSCPHYARSGYDYWHQPPDRRLVAGGRRDADLEAEFTAVEETTPTVQERLEEFVRDLLGGLPRITHRWSGIFGTTDDRLPLVGRVPGHERVWCALGYSGHGNVMGLACGELVARAVLGQPAPELAFFDPARAA